MTAWLKHVNSTHEIERNIEKQLRTQYQLSLSEFYVMYYLYQESNKTLRQNELQNHLNITQSALSRLIVRLETHDQHIVQRYVCTQDGRGVCIVLTDSGSKLLEESIQIVDALLKESKENKKFLHSNKGVKYENKKLV